MARIAYIVNSLNPGGTENLVVQMSLAFSNRHSMMVICLDEPGLWAEKLRKSQIPVHCIYRQAGLDFRTAVKIAALTRKHKTEIIHAHQCTAWFYGALSRLFFNKPKLLLEEHGRHYPETRNIKKNTVNKLLIQRLTHEIVAVSQDIGKRLTTFEGIPANRIRVIYNGVELPVQLPARKKAALRDTFSINTDEFLIGSVGRLDAVKNYPLLIKTYAKFLKQYPKARLMLVGEGPERDKLENLTRELQISNKVVFTGFRQDATAILQTFDLFVLCSFSEGTSMALLEAMGAAIPAVVTRVGGNPELVQANNSGWVVTSDSTDELLTALQEAAGDPEKSKKYADNARALFAARFTFERMLEEYQHLYQSMPG